MPTLKTQEEVIADFKKVHGGTYNYSNVVYKNSHDKVTITCHIHGNFEQTPSKHLSGQGCRKCANENRKNADFVERSAKIHNSLYDYSLVQYSRVDGKVKIICRQHGVFEQRAGNHLNGQGCPKCKNLDLDEFIARSKAVHGDTYDYSKSVFSTTQQKVNILCKEHGEFWQVANSHMKGHGCAKCHKESRFKTDFVNRATIVHKGKYTYGKSIYTKSVNKVTITCPIHGDFDQVALSHLRGRGCPKCKADSRRITNFVERCKKTHGDRYDYSLVDYKDCRLPVKIICPVHGVFEQNASKHERGSGCPDCAPSGFNYKIPAKLYVYQILFEGKQLIGYGITNNLKNRITRHKVALNRRKCEYSIKYTLSFNTGLEAFNIEQDLKATFDRVKIDLIGFKTENTSIENLQAFESYIDTLGIPRETLDKS